MGAKISLSNGTSWERINRTKDPEGRETSTRAAVNALLEKEPAASLLSSNWRCGAVAIAQCPGEGSYRIIAGSREESGRVAFQVKIWDISDVRPAVFGASENERPPPCKTSLRFSMGGHTGPVTCAAISENSLVGATAGDDLGILVWDLKRGKLRVRLGGHSKQIKCVALTPNGNWGLSCSWDKTVKFWDLFKGKCLASAEGYTPQDNLGKVPKSRPKGEQKDEEVRGHTAGVQGCDLRVTTHPGEAPGGLGVTASWDGSVKLWDLAGMAVVRTLRGHQGCVWGCGLAHDTRTAVSCGADRTVRVWDCSTGECLVAMEGHEKDAISCSLRGDAALIASASWDMSVRLWDVRKGVCRRRAQVGLDRPCCVSLSPDGLLLVAAHEDDTIAIMVQTPGMLPDARWVCMERITVRVKVPMEARSGASEKDKDASSPIKKSDSPPLELELDPDDAFYSLCEALFRALCDRDKFSASHQYAELPPQFQRFNWAKHRVGSVAPIGAGSRGLQIPGTASTVASSRVLGGNSTERQSVAGSTWDADSRRVTVGTREKPQPAKPAFTYEEHSGVSLRDLGFKHGSELQLLKPIDVFEEKSTDEIKELGRQLSGNLWWEKQEKAAALLLKEYADHKAEMRHQRRQKREVKFGSKGVGAGIPLGAESPQSKVDLLSALSKDKKEEQMPVAPIEMFGASFATPAMKR